LPLSEAGIEGTMAEKVRFWWTLLVSWLLSFLPLLHAHDSEPHRAGIVRSHDPDAETEWPTRAVIEPQRAQIAPAQPPPPRQIMAQPKWDDYIAAEHWVVQRAMETTIRRNTAALLSVPPEPT